MNKLISFIVFITAFSWTWFLFHSEGKMSVALHAGLQSKLALMIEDTIKHARPNAYNFQMLSMSTKNLEDNKVGAFFTYRFSEKLEDKESSEQTIKGEAILNRTVSENADDQKWILQSVKTNNSIIEFQEGAIIGSGPNADAPAEVKTEAPAEANPENKTEPDIKKTE